MEILWPVLAAAGLAAGALGWRAARRSSRALLRAAEHAEDALQTRPASPSGGAEGRLRAGIEAMTERLRLGARQTSGGEQALTAVLEAMADGVIVVGADQKVRQVNSALLAAFDLRREQALGAHYWEVFRDPEINSLFEACLRTRRPARKEHEPLLTRSTFQIHAAPVLDGQEPAGAAAVFTDVTKLKELERLRSEFVANVSHELKTPLTAILGFVETLNEGAADNPEDRRQFLGIIEEQSRKLLALIESLLVLSQIESGRQEPDRQEVEMGALFARALTPFRRALEAGRLTSQAEVRPDPLVFRADAQMIDQLLSNLIDNAIKYNRPGGTLRLAGRAEPDGIVIEVSDTGIGIPPSDLPRVFERFYRVDKSRSRELGGSGLGLAIAKHIVERHGGRIEAESRLGEGTRFRVFLPD